MPAAARGTAPTIPPRTRHSAFPPPPAVKNSRPAPRRGVFSAWLDPNYLGKSRCGVAPSPISDESGRRRSPESPLGSTRVGCPHARTTWPASPRWRGRPAPRPNLGLLIDLDLHFPQEVAQDVNGGFGFIDEALGLVDRLIESLDFLARLRNLVLEFLSRWIVLSTFRCRRWSWGVRVLGRCRRSRQRG